jgi:hypothetical protein
MIAFPRSKYRRSCEAWTSGRVSTVIQTTDHSLWSGSLPTRWATLAGGLNPEPVAVSQAALRATAQGDNRRIVVPLCP